MNKAVAPPALGHCAIDQLVLVDQVLPINDRVTDLDHAKRVVVTPRFIDRKIGLACSCDTVFRTPLNALRSKIQTTVPAVSP
jgi:hypothetical protein